MRILLSNDDGILAPGLAALHWAIADMGDVSVVAPDSPQSAAGHSITLTHPLAVRKVKVEALGSFTGISVDGRPADCVRLAIRSLLPQRPDLVVAGINAGSNVGINVLYSGTVAAATEGAMLGVPAVAFSASMKGGEVDFARIGELCRGVLDGLLAMGLGEADLVNVNIPTLVDGQCKGIRVVRQSTSGIEDIYQCEVVNGLEQYQIGKEYGFLPCDPDTDVVAVADGYITVTPLQIDRTDHSKMARLAETFGKIADCGLPATPKPLCGEGGRIADFKSQDGGDTVE